MHIIFHPSGGKVSLSLLKLKCMIQRRQSLFLAASILLLVFSYFIPFGTIMHGEELLFIRSYGLKSADGNYLPDISTYWFHLPLSLIVLLNGYTLFKYRERKSQIIWLKFTFLLFAVSFVLLSMFISGIPAALPGSVLTAGPAIACPFLALLLNWLAARAIRKDEELVRSVDRIR
jgi:multidrug transporter EmrE-like cation transporter